MMNVHLEKENLNFSSFVFVVTGMSYIIDSSGTSKVVKAHEKVFVDAGIGYVVIFPISRSRGEGASWHVKTTGCYALIINGKLIDIVTSNEVLNYLVELTNTGKKCIGILVHHLIRNNIEEIQRILSTIIDVPVVFYLHDFYSCCINPAMMRNDEESCLSGYHSCEGCVFENKRTRHIEVIKRFFSAFAKRLSFVAPSDYVKQKWVTYYPEYVERVRVISHQKAIGSYEQNKAQIGEDEHIKIAYVGTQTRLKGWEVFKNVVTSVKERSCNYKFYYCGNGNDTIPNVESIPVEIAKMGNDAMIRALRENGISVVLLLSLCSETYSYTMYEAHAANSFIIALRESGNLDYMVANQNWGIVCDRESDLISLLLHETTFRKQLNDWRSNCQAGAEKYVDNDAILELFPTSNSGTVVWQRKSVSMTQGLKRRIVGWLFLKSRMKGK